MCIRVQSAITMKWESSNTNRQGKGRSAFPAFAYALLFTFLLFSFPVRYLAATDAASARSLKSWLLFGQRSFTISYIHSVELTEVREVYRIEQDDIYLSETVFFSYGAGLPSTTPYSFEMTEEGFRIYDIDEKVDPLIYRTGAVRADHRLIIGARDIPFLDFSQPAEAVMFQSRKSPFIIFLIKEFFYE
jgi:hypothetical protein